MSTVVLQSSAEEAGISQPVTGGDADAGAAAPVADVTNKDVIDVSQELSDSSTDGVPLVRTQQRVFPLRSVTGPQDQPPAKKRPKVPLSAPPAGVPSLGARIEVLWDEENWYPCIIERNKWDVDSSYVSWCVYDDESRYWHNLLDETWRPIVTITPAESSSGDKSVSTSTTVSLRSRAKSRKSRSTGRSKSGHSKSVSNSGSKSARSRRKRPRSRRKKQSPRAPDSTNNQKQIPCNHRSVFLEAEPSSLILEGGTCVVCPTCPRRDLWVCSMCYRVYCHGNKKNHLKICVGSKLVHQNKRRYRDASTGKFREGRCNVPRSKLRGAPPDPTGLMKMDTSLTPSFPPHVYRNAYVAGRTPCVDRSRLSEAELLSSILDVFDSAGVGKRNLVSYRSSRLTPSRGGLMYVAEGSAAVVTQPQMFEKLQDEAPCYMTIEVNDMSADDFQVFLDFAPPPRAIQGFLYRRVFVFISRCDAGAVIYPHRDQGGGPLVFAASAPGGRTLFAVTGPTQEDESAPDRLRGAFDHLRNNQRPNDGVHYAALSRTGEYLSVPSGYWHTVMSEGFRVCVSYFDQCLDKR